MTASKKRKPFLTPKEVRGRKSQELVPTLPSGEWYMPDLRSTHLDRGDEKRHPL